jgi:hypothetical protein
MAPYIINATGRRIFRLNGTSVHRSALATYAYSTPSPKPLAQSPLSPHRYTNTFAIELARRLVEIAPMRPTKLLFAPSITMQVQHEMLPVLR